MTKRFAALALVVALISGCAAGEPIKPSDVLGFFGEALYNGILDDNEGYGRSDSVFPEHEAWKGDPNPRR